MVPIAASQYIGGPIVAADFNHDGKLDLAVVGIDSTSNTVYILPGTGNGLFSSADPVLTVPGEDNVSGQGIQKMLLGDFDGDQNADLAVVATTGNQATGDIATVMIHVLYGNGNFTFDDTAPITSSNFRQCSGHEFWRPERRWQDRPFCYRRGQLPPRFVLRAIRPDLRELLPAASQGVLLCRRRGLLCARSRNGGLQRRRTERHCDYYD